MGTAEVKGAEAVMAGKCDELFFKDIIKDVATLGRRETEK